MATKSAIHTFKKGMVKDIDRSLLSNEAYLNALNLRIVTSVGESTGAMENVKGNNNISAIDLFPSDQYICGYAQLRDYIILFTTSNTTTPVTGVGRNMIHKLIINKDTETVTSLTTLYDDSLNGSTGTLDFSTANRIKAVSRYETPNIQKIYWTDGYNNIRYADVAKNLTVTGNPYTLNDYMDPKMFEFLPPFNQSKPTLYGIVGGHLQSGMVQYAYQLYRLNGATTAFSPVSDLIHITSSNDFSSNTLSYKGSEEGEITGKGCKISIVNDNTGYSRLRLVRIFYSSYNAVPLINIVSEVEISSSPSTVIVTDIGDSTGDLTLDEFNITSTELFSCEDIATKNNRLFAAGIEKEEFVVEDWDARAVRYRNGNGSAEDTTGYVSLVHGSSDVAFTIYNTETIIVTINNFATNFCSGRDVTEVIDITSDSSYSGYDIIYGTYTSVSAGSGQDYHSLRDNTWFTPISYDSASDIFVFRVTDLTGSGYGYFLPDYISLDAGVIYSLSISYVYDTGLPATQARIRNGELGDTDYSVDTIGMPATDDVAGWTAAGWYSEYTETHDGINDFNDSDNDGNATYAYKYQIDGTTLGAEGPNIKIGFETETFVLDSSNLGTTFSVTSTEDSFSNYASPWKNGNLSWQRDEVYRLFIVWLNDRGQRSIPQWIVDLKMPSLHDVGYSTLASYSATTGEVSSTILRPTVLIKSMPSNATSCQIYRVKRDREDRSVVTQGLAIPTYDGGSSIYYSNSIRGNLLSTDGAELVKIVSPDINVNKNIVSQSNDYIEYVSYFNDSLATDVIETTDYVNLAGYVNKFTSKLITNTRVAFSSNCVAGVEEAKSIIPAIADSASETVIVNNRTYCNYYPYSASGAYVVASKGSSGLLVSYDNASWSAEGGTYRLVNYRSDVFNSQYGGYTYEDRGLNISLPCSDIISTSDTVYSLKGGDVFINYFDVSTLVYDLSVADANSSISEVVYVPLESSINCDLRHDINCQHLTYAVVKSAIRQEYAGEHTVGTSSVSYEQERDLYLYNTVYSQQTSVQNAISDSLDTSDETVFDCLVKASDIKYNGETSDSWTNFRVNEEIEVDSSYGAIRALYVFNDKLLFWQENSFGVLSVNERSLINDGSTSQLVLGTGGVLDRYDYIATSIGILSKESIISSESMLYWFYDKDTSIYRFGESLLNLTKNKGMLSWFRNNYTSNYNVHGVYDKLYNDVIYTLYNPTTKGGYTLAFNEQVDQFVSFYSFVPRMYIDFINGYLSVVDEDENTDENVFGYLYNNYAATHESFEGVKYGYLYNWYAASNSYVNEVEFGLLYNQQAVLSTDSLANTGYHVATKDEFDSLITYLGGSTVAGGKLKEVGTTHWDSPNTGATNEVGFNLRGNDSIQHGMFLGIKQAALLWTGTDGYYFAAYKDLTIGNTYLVPDYPGDTYHGFGVRLVKDTTTLSNGETGTYVGNDGKIYDTICINGVEWLSENLCETKFRSGTRISLTSAPEAWESIFDPQSIAYNCDWDTYAQSLIYDANLSVANTGYHVATLSDLTTLQTFLGGEAVSGGKLKVTGTTYWDSPNTGATNEVGFGLPGAGWRGYDYGLFYDLKTYAEVWTKDFPYLRTSASAYIGYDDASFNIDSAGSFQPMYRNYGNSIWILKDSTTLTDGQTGTYTGNDGKIYNTVCIGTQEWVCGNICETKYRNGSDIPEVTDGTAWSLLTAGGRCSYGNDETYAVEGTANIAPIGWHIPTKTEMETLVTELGGSSVAGGYMKETGTVYWSDPNVSADNSSGFNGRGSGDRTVTGAFENIYEAMALWASDNDLSSNPYSWIACEASAGSSNSVVTTPIRTYGLALRAIKDDSTDPGTVTDYDGNVYATVKIGDQVWMAENLRVTHYNDGTAIPNVADDAAWDALTTDAYCSYLDSVAYNGSALYLHNSNITPRCTFYNALYNSTIKILFNDDYVDNKVFDNIFYASTEYNSSGYEQQQASFNTIRCYNTLQNTGYVALTLGDTLERREREWMLAVPRNAVDTTYPTNVDVLSASNLDTTRLYRERMRDKYLIVDLIYVNDGNRFFFPYIGIKYRISQR